MGKSAGRVFVVERETIIDRPPEIQGLAIYQFCTLMPDPEEQVYHQKIDDLVVQLAGKLKSLQASAQQTQPSEGGVHIGDVGGDVNLQAGGDIVAGNKTVQQTIENRYIIQQEGPRATVFLAEVTDDLQEQRNDVKRYLEQQQFQVLPESLYYFSGANAAEQLQQAIDVDLHK